MPDEFEYPKDGWCNNCNCTYINEEDRAQGCSGISGYCPIFNHWIENGEPDINANID